MLKQLKPSTKYTLSYDIKANRSGAISHSICKGDVSNFCTNTVVVNNIIGNETWQHISVVLTTNDLKTTPTNDLKTTPTNEILYLGRNALSKVGYSIIKNLKLVEGDIDTPWSPSQSDIEGKGVVETVQYYLATSQASGVTSSTSGWSTDITTQKLTADKKYLWNCYQTKYSDGTSEPISTPNVIGVYGDKGTSTKIIRTSYKYTQNKIDTFSASGYSRTWGTADATTGLKVGDNVLLRVKNTTKGSDCLIFANITAIPSNYSLTCTSYGVIDNGSDGQDGAGFHWNLLKYSGDLSKQVLGGAGTYTATVESIEDKTTPSGQAEKITYTVQGTGGKFIQTGKYIKEGDIKQGKTYTVSVWCKCSSIKSTGVINAEFLDNKTYVNPTLSTEWQQYVVTGVANKDVTSTSSASAISFYYSDNMSVGDIFYISSPKVEEGDKASPWCTTYEETLAKNLSITPSSQYFKSTDGGKTFAPNTITIKPTIQGEISFGKWQYSIDGGVSFADVVSGQKGLTVSNNVLTVSKDSSLYSDAVTMITFRAVASDSSFYDTCSIAKIYDVSDIGDGRNLLTGVSSYTKDTPFEKTDSRADGWTMYQNIITSIELEAGKKYVLQAKTDGNWAANHDINGQDPSKKLVTLWLCSDKTNNCFDMRQGYAVFTPTVTAKYKLRVNQYSNGTDAYTIHLWDIKLEKGSSPTGWTPAPEDVQTAILSTKSEISDVSLKVDKNKQAIEQRVEKTTYQQDLNLVKGDISKANEGLNKWRYEIYPKSLFASEYQGKSTMDVFAKNTNLTPSQSVLINDTDFGKSWAYGDNYIGYALTFVKFSAAKSIAITFKHDDGAHLYLNGKLIGGDDTCNTGSGESLTLSFIQGWNCLEVVLNEKSGGEYIGLGTTISAISECQLMNCYYGTPVARQSHITNQLVENTTNIDGVSGSVQKVMSTVGGSSKIDEFVNNYSTWKKKVDGIETRVGKTYVTKNDFDGLEIGGVNLFVKSTASIGWWISDTGVLNANGGWGYSDYINVSGMKNYIASGFTNLGISPATCFYDSNKTFISGVQSTNQNSQDSKRKTLPIPSNAKYMRFSFMRVDIDTLKIEQGTKATAYSPAPEDDEINGQNLVSNLPSNWEQGTVTEGSTTGTTYANTKSSSAGSVRPKELIPVSGNITISTAYSNQSKKPIRHWIAAYDVNKNYLGNNYVSNAWNSFPRTLNMKDAKYIAIMVGYTDSSAITPSDISQICLKIERGTSATPFTLAPEDVNGKIVNVETIANQTADKFSWIVKSGTSSSNFEITDRLMNLVSANINLDGIVSFMNTAKGDGRKNLYNLDYSSFENVASQEDAICYAKDNGVTSVGIDSSVSYDGDKSLKISYTTANLNSSTTPLYLGSSANNYGCVKIQAGKQYILSCYVKSDSTTGLFMIDIQGHDTPDTKTDGLYLSNIDPRKLPGSSTGVNLSTDWQRAVCAIKVADNATGLYWSVVPLIWGKPSSSSAPKTFNIWVDCIMLEEVDSISNEPGTYILDKETIIDGGSVKADTITGNQILAGSITADKIATDAIKSRNYDSSGGTQGSFLNLGDGSFTSPNLSWDSNGNLIAKNANLSGEITATNGSIAGWTIISNKMYTTGSGKYTGIGKYGSAYAFWAGATSNDNGNSAVFKVGHTGKLTATDADITGTITATNGKIGRYDITSTYLMTNSGSNASGIGGNQAFWAGAEDSNSAPFRVGYDGVLWAENAAIRGSIETGNLGDEGDTVSIINGHIGIQGTSNNVEIYSTGFKFGIDGDYYLMSVSEGVKCYRNLYATDFVADGWLYCSEVHSSGAVVIGADSESFYWAHGYQIARGTSWGGVCVGDDSQQLRLYGSSIWASHSISTSDENLKENFTTLDQYENFYMNLNPIGFNYIGDYDGKKTHFGFGAHKTEDVLESEGYDADKFAVVTHRPLVQEDIEKRFGKDVEVDIETEYGVSYTEFIALNTHMIQKTRRELTKVKQEKADLEVRLQAIEAKLGL
ncbi:MAG: tail fiber domain-containing protein [Anaerostipes hadrus]